MTGIVEASSMLGASRQKITLQPGDTIDDFDLLTRLGGGALATVFLARRKCMQRLCALQVSVTRSNEAQTLAQLDHPNIVRVCWWKRLRFPTIHHRCERTA